MSISSLWLYPFSLSSFSPPKNVSCKFYSLHFSLACALEHHHLHCHRFCPIQCPHPFTTANLYQFCLFSMVYFHQFFMYSSDLSFSECKLHHIKSLLKSFLCKLIMNSKIHRGLLKSCINSPLAKNSSLLVGYCPCVL